MDIDSAGTTQNRWKRTAVGLLKAAVSFLLLYALIEGTDLNEILRSLKMASVSHLALFLALNAAVVAVNTTRWRVMLAAQDVTAGFWKLAYYYLVGIFFNNLLPGSVGGDIYRIVGVAGQYRHKEKAVSTVFLERVMGLVVLAPVCLTAALLLLDDVVSDPLLLASLCLVVFSVLVVGFFVNAANVRALKPLYDGILRPFGRIRLKERLVSFYDGMQEFRDRRDALWIATTLSLASRLVWIAACWLLASSMGFGLGVTVFLLVMPLVEFVRMIPVTLNGLGLREWACVAYLGAFGISGPDALAFCIIVYAALLALGLVGGLVFGLNALVRTREA